MALIDGDGTRKTLRPAPKRSDLDALVARAIKAFEAMPREAQEAMLHEQRESWARGNLGIERGSDVPRTVSPEKRSNAERPTGETANRAIPVLMPVDTNQKSE